MSLVSNTATCQEERTRTERVQERWLSSQWFVDISGFWIFWRVFWSISRNSELSRELLSRSSLEPRLMLVSLTHFIFFPKPSVVSKGTAKWLTFGGLSLCLGIQVRQYQGSKRRTQKVYIFTLEEKLGVTHCRTPAEASCRQEQGFGSILTSKKCSRSLDKIRRFIPSSII